MKITCIKCHGTGKIEGRNASWWKFWVNIKCDRCNGKGTEPPSKFKPFYKKKYGCAKGPIKDGSMVFLNKDELYRMPPVKPPVKRQRVIIPKIILEDEPELVLNLLKKLNSESNADEIVFKFID